MSAYTAKHLQHYQHPPPILCQNLPNISSSYIMSTYDHIWPHSANICPSFQHLPTLCQHLSKTANICWHYAKICGHLPTLCQPLGPLCTHYANICALFQHMLTLCQLVVSDCPLSLMYFNIVVILTWKVPSLHKVCLRRNVKSGVFTLMPIS